MRHSNDAIPDALRHFDVLPDSSYVRSRVVQGLLDCSRATVHRRVADGTLPKPIHLSPGTAAFRVGDLRKALGLLVP